MLCHMRLHYIFRLVTRMYHSRLVSSPDKTEVGGSSPPMRTMLPWTADPLMTTGGDRLVNRLW